MSVNVEAKEKEIDGLRFTCVPFAAMRATKLSARLGRLLGPSFSPLAYAVSKHGEQLDDDVLLTLAGGVLGTTMEKLDDDTAEATFLAILAGTSAVVDGKRVDITDVQEFDRVFTGRNPTVFKAAYFALGVNYAGFTEGSSRIAGIVKATVSRLSSTPT